MCTIWIRHSCLHCICQKPELCALKKRCGFFKELPIGTLSVPLPNLFVHMKGVQYMDVCIANFYWYKYNWHCLKRQDYFLLVKFSLKVISWNVDPNLKHFRSAAPNISTLVAQPSMFVSGGRRYTCTTPLVRAPSTQRRELRMWAESTCTYLWSFTYTSGRHLHLCVKLHSHD